TGVQTCALPISAHHVPPSALSVEERRHRGRAPTGWWATHPRAGLLTSGSDGRARCAPRSVPPTFPRGARGQLEVATIRRTPVPSARWGPPDHSGGTAPDSHRLPSLNAPTSGGAPEGGAASRAAHAGRQGRSSGGATLRETVARRRGFGPPPPVLRGWAHPAAWFHGS